MFAIDDSRFEEILSPEEFGSIKQKIFDELIPNLSTKTSDICYSRSLDENPEQYIRQYKKP
ncbi:MAG: hypothetical protein R3E95_19955 [Thiolinea sp.]